MSVADAGLLGIAREGRSRRLNDVASDLRSLLSSYEAQGVENARLRAFVTARAEAPDKPHWASPDGSESTNDYRNGYWTAINDIASVARSALTQPPAMEKTDG